MTEVLHIRSSGIPRLRCFDRKTPIYLQDGTFKYIQDIKVNDILLDKSIVTSKIKVTSEGLDMYNLNGTIVSESHIVRCDSNWTPVKYHPLAIKINNYNEPYLYCLNTSTKIIVINNIIFTDWDEVYDYNLEFICDFMKKHNLSHIDEGYDKNTKIKLKNGEVSLKDIKIGEILSTEGIVYGIVELSSSINLGNKEPLYNLLVSNGIFQSGIDSHFDYNKNIDTILDFKKNII